MPQTTGSEVRIGAGTPVSLMAKNRLYRLCENANSPFESAVFWRTPGAPSSFCEARCLRPGWGCGGGSWVSLLHGLCGTGILACALGFSPLSYRLSRPGRDVRHNRPLPKNKISLTRFCPEPCIGQVGADDNVYRDVHVKKLFVVQHAEEKSHGRV